MPTHDIIDNRNQKLVDQINRILDTTESAKFAVGYFFLSGFTAIAKPLTNIKQLRLLIGNTSNRETIEQIAQGYRRLELIADKIEAQTYPKRSEEKRMAQDTAANIRSSIELMDQTDEAETLVKNLVQMIEEKRLQVRVYTKGTLHAKAYIFDYGTIYDAKGRLLERTEKGIAVVGSSNLTLSGISHNTELNVIIHGNDNHRELTNWFEELWNEAEDFNEALMREMKQSWAVSPVTPYDIYMKTLYSLVKDRLEDINPKDLILQDDEITKQLAEFQKVAVNNAVQNIRDYGGAFVSDVVGLGKSFIGAAIVKRFEQTERARPLIICPAPLLEMWERYNEVYQLNARILSMGMLKEGEESGFKVLLEDFKYKDRDFVLIDESHNLRNHNTQRYKVLETFLAAGKRCCLLTATPRNKSAWDIYHQLKLFHQDDNTDLPIDPPNLKEYFQLVEKGEKKLPELLSHILIRRTRNHILRFYGRDSQTHKDVDSTNFREYLDGTRRAYVVVGGKHRFFPKRELETIEYSIEDTYQGLYQELRQYMGKSRKRQLVKPPTNELSYARYGLWNYVLKDKQKQEPYNTLQRAGSNLRGLMRVLLFKRFESSVYAFQETIKKLLLVHERFVNALSQGFIPAGEEAQTLLSEDVNAGEEQDLIDGLRQVSDKYDLADFDGKKLQQHIAHDINIFKKIIALVEPITPDKDAKLQTLLKWLNKPLLRDKKRLIFTQYADTARYLYENLNPQGKCDDIEVIYSGSNKNKSRLVGRFAPNANREYKFKSGESEINTLVATDVLAEGLNLQDGDLIINYDLHWNPVKLIQRFGRIDRIGSEKDIIYGYNFLPELGIERNLGLRQKLKNRIQEIHDTIGEDAAILDGSEQLNEEAMYAIYEQEAKQLSLFDNDEEDFLNLNEAEEILRKLQKDNPEEFERIANLPQGIRTAKFSLQHQGTFVFCEASDPNRPDIKGYQQLFLLDNKGNIVSRDIPRILGAIKADSTIPSITVPQNHNSQVMGVKNLFAEEVKHRQAEREFNQRLTQGQRYILRELRMLFKIIVDEEVKSQINILEKAFRSSLTQVVNRELNILRRNGITGEELFNQLVRIYRQHNIQEWVNHHSISELSRPIPMIICSEGFIIHNS
ncbi:DNA/RNA helicase, superfamily II [Cylindrospermum stagnale PCC 7417]|uniref:DNA/RNA helicase, superfamily II n=1 Tax=Cylindrospermum stagnale PCC 7417 TaxID=56107 RepID=K9WVL0_9NOST|nr:helicase-related protein [Cylindrospermum stagnale]AFZ23826.1 DNA/RNA helicase, superfamily II [Cylindrospermum stagnale PCC 7417]